MKFFSHRSLLLLSLLLGPHQAAHRRGVLPSYRPRKTFLNNSAIVALINAYENEIHSMFFLRFHRMFAFDEPLFSGAPRDKSTRRSPERGGDEHKSEEGKMSGEEEL